MKVNSVNFKGLYTENITTQHKDRVVEKELKNARPFLKLLAQNLPYDKDIFVRVMNDPCDTILSVNCIDKKEQKIYNLAKGNEHTLTGSGCFIMEDTFKGLEKYDKKVFDVASKGFVKSIANVERIANPLPRNDKYICLDCGCVIER